MGAIEDEASEGLISSQIRQSRRRWSSTILLVFPWMLSAFFCCTTIILALGSRNILWNKHKYETGFSTDFAPSSNGFPIRIAKKKFTNDLLFNSSSQSFFLQPLDENETRYVGEPSPAIDAAWNDLLHAQYVALEDREAQQIPVEHRAKIWHGGDEFDFMELGVFHNLHCLNEIRTVLDQRKHEYHNPKIGRNRRDGRHHTIHTGRVHLDHCIDQIRQALMCHSDLTPVPMMPVEGMPDTFLGNGEAHTCRDFDAIWKWVEMRGRKRKSLGE